MMLDCTYINQYLRSIWDYGWNTQPWVSVYRLSMDLESCAVQVLSSY